VGDTSGYRGGNRDHHSRGGPFGCGSLEPAVRRWYREAMARPSARKTKKNRRRRRRPYRPLLHISQILEWADEHFERTGRWPTISDGPVARTAGEKWMNINAALIQGLRGLPGRSSLAKLLADRRGKRNIGALPPLTVSKVLKWADIHFARHGVWPSRNAGPIDSQPGEAWRNINAALHRGGRGLPGGSSLAKLLDDQRGVRNPANAPRLSTRQILEWADVHHLRTGKWPNLKSGPLANAPGETWQAISQALYAGQRGLPGGSTLARLLAAHRGVRNRKGAAPLTLKKILAWADAHFRRTGGWPNARAGRIVEAPGETWLAVDKALWNEGRGWSGRTSLARLLAKHRGTESGANRRPTRPRR